MDTKILYTDRNWRNTFLNDENGRMIKNLYAVEIHAANKKMAKIRVFKKTKGIVPYGIFANVIATHHNYEENCMYKTIYNHVLIKSIWDD